jgi:hypothetical protein
LKRLKTYSGGTINQMTRKLITAIVPLWIFTAFALMRFNYIPYGEDIALIMLSIPMFFCLYILSMYAFAAPIDYIAEKLERKQQHPKEDY